MITNRFVRPPRYTYDQQFDKTLHIYLRLKRPHAFDLIGTYPYPRTPPHAHGRADELRLPSGKYNLFHAIQDKVLLLIECDQDRAIKLFVDNVDKVPVRTPLSRSACFHASANPPPQPPRLGVNRSRPWFSN